jgi:CheY-like chemotaxis protein
VLPPRERLVSTLHGLPMNGEPASRPASPASTHRRLTVLLAEDDLELRAFLSELLRKEGHAVVELPDGTALLAELAFTYLYAESLPSHLLVLTDLRMPGSDSLSVIRSLQAKGRFPPFLLITAFGDPDVHREAEALGALAVFDKPVDLDELRSVLRRLSFQPAAADPPGKGPADLPG